MQLYAGLNFYSLADVKQTFILLRYDLFYTGKTEATVLKKASFSNMA